MSLDRCRICNEFLFDCDKNHKCAPKWLCRICDDETDQYTEEQKAEWFTFEIYARDAGDAAEKCADNEESNWDYSFIKNGGVDVDVMDADTKEVKKLYVSAEQVIEYYASERKE